MDDEDKIFLLQNRKDAYKLSIRKKVTIFLTYLIIIIPIIITAIINYGTLAGLLSTLITLIIIDKIKMIQQIKRVSNQIKEIDKCIYYITTKKKPEYDIDKFIENLYLKS